MKTLDYYNKNAMEFITSTKDVDFKQVQDKFLAYLKPNSYILDFGCGSGRDTKYFLSQNYQVDAIDGSSELCKYASDYTGIEVKQMLFNELAANNQYDAIWACSSILHLPYEELIDVLNKMVKAIKNEGIIYTSFKYGDFEGERNGRYFIFFTLESFKELLAKISGITLVEYWISGDVREDRGDERWLNVILQKK